MNFKTTWILFGVLALLLGVLAFTLRFHRDAAERNPDRLFPSAQAKDKERQFKADDVTKVVIERKKPMGEDIVFQREDKTWKITAPRGSRADSARISTLVDAILDARVDQQFKPENLKKAGLDSPSRIITLSSKDGSRTLTLGGSVPGDDGVYYVLSSEWAKKPLAVAKRDIVAALESPAYFRAKELLGESTGDITSLKITHGKKGGVELAKDKDRWRFVQPSYGDASLDGGLLNQLGELRVEYRNEKENDFVQDGVTDLAKVDPELPKSDELRIEVGRGDDPKKLAKTAVVILTGKKAGEKYYAYVDDGGKEKDVVKVNAKVVEPLLKILDDPSALRSKNLLALEPFKSPDAIDVQNSYGLLEFRKPEGARNWELFRDGKGNATDEAAIRLLLDALNRPNQIVSFPDPKRRAELGLEKPEVTVKVWSDSLDKPDDKAKGGKPPFKKDAKAVTELRFGNREGDNVAVERLWGTDSTIVMVPAVTIDQLKQRPLAYFDKSVPGFATGAGFDQDVTKIEVTRAGGEAYELTREKPGAPWKFTKPEAWKGRGASEQVVREILMDVNRLPVREVSAEKADAADLGKVFGLDKPANKVIVTSTKDKKDTTFVVDLGKEVSGKGYYAKVSSKDTIYLVDGKVLEALKKDPRDATVFNFDPSKVVSVKLTGWQKLLGGAESRTLEKKDGKWIIKEKPELNVDQDKVRQSLDGLANLHAERFVQAGKGLTTKENALLIEVTLDDKKTLNLTIGEAEGNDFYATSDQLKGDVFLVRKDLFEAAKNSPAVFVK